MALIRRDNGMHEHSVKKRAADLTTVGKQDGEVKLEIVSQFFLFGLKNDAQLIQCGLRGKLTFWPDINEVAIVGGRCKGDAEDVTASGVERCGLEVETETICNGEFFDQGV